MVKARIYQPTKTAMQSGRAKTSQWVLEYAPNKPKTPDNLMGWNGSLDTTEQLFLRFSSKQAAIKYAESKGIPYEIKDPKARVIQPKSYAENFSFKRVRT